MQGVSAETLASLSSIVQKEQQGRLDWQAAQQKQADEVAWRKRIFQLCSAQRCTEVHGEVPVEFAPEGGGAKSVRGLLADRSSQLAVIVCHPWGVMGGSMHDVAVSAVVETCARAGVTTLRFDFRSDVRSLLNLRGHAAAADLRGAWRFLRSVGSSPSSVVLVGYSYGALVVADVAPKLDGVSAFAMISPPLGFEAPLFVCRAPSVGAAASTKPKLVLMGTEDVFCKQARFEAYTESLAEPSRCHLLRNPGASCGDGSCRKVHAQPVTHFNVWEHIEKHLAPWLAETFGCEVEKLGGCDGSTVGGGRRGISSARE